MLALRVEFVDHVWGGLAHFADLAWRPLVVLEVRWHLKVVQRWFVRHHREFVAIPHVCAVRPLLARLWRILFLKTLLLRILVISGCRTWDVIFYINILNFELLFPVTYVIEWLVDLFNLVDLLCQMREALSNLIHPVDISPFALRLTLFFEILSSSWATLDTPTRVLFYFGLPHPFKLFILIIFNLKIVRRINWSVQKNRIKTYNDMYWI